MTQELVWHYGKPLILVKTGMLAEVTKASLERGTGNCPATWPAIYVSSVRVWSEFYYDWAKRQTGVPLDNEMGSTFPPASKPAHPPSGPS